MGRFQFSPVEQFDIFSVDWWGWSISGYVLYCISICLLFTLWFLGSRFSYSLLPVPWYFLAEWFYGLVSVQFVSQYLGPKGRRYFSFLFIVFFFILFGNFFGLVPYAKTPTNYLALTLVLSFSMLVGCIVLGFFEHDVAFLRMFVLKLGWLFLGLLAAMEMVSYLMRGFSLAMSLSANMTAGHTLLHVLASFCVSAADSSYLAMLLMACLLLFVLSLEFFVALVQAFVFVVLVCLYTNDSLLYPGH